MCGRYALALSNEELYDSLEARLPRLFENGRPRWERAQDNRGGNYNVAPRQRAPVIRRDPQDGGRGLIETMQWGLVPHWTKHPPTGPLNTINARSEGLLDASSGGMWHALKGYKRCIVPAQGYYEWLKKPSTKIPHFTRLPLDKSTTVDHPPLLFFAGLYDIVKYVEPVQSKFVPSDDPSDTREAYPTGNPIPLATYTILTTVPSPDLRWLHDRMPVILTEWQDVYDWLDLGEVKGWTEGKEGTGRLLNSFEGLDCYPVPTEVGKIGNNSPTFIQPVSERKDGIKSFFSKQQQSPVKVKHEQSSKKEGSDGQAENEKDDRDKKDAKNVKEEVAEGIDSEITPKDEEKGLGDDSNAPNPDSVKREIESESAVEKANGKRKREGVEEGEDQEKEGKEAGTEDGKPLVTPKRGTGGHQIKVIRKNTDEGDKEQPAITNFFKSPSRPQTDTKPPAQTTRGRGRKKR
ncbi:uncharacterized protein I303_105577 [Kwoniella dejecticola CBS 10117]|uniref:DUF159-domain-containing protein n=1 Tax=Kwoniella dejecticola CBS 10117 TaxID=1296121 RepID=A0A1A6A238_9TREE|nr:uncharacterized protein I303_04980 [Kwoniella dejecticola CBS 10117]OBR84123.1 hypothetical protein I303_04980 [Kwoniella dejecticola CBS 10117]